MYFPVMINLELHQFIIIGGGKVALRKATKINEFGGQIICISPVFEEGFKSLNNVQMIMDAYNEDYLDGKSLVIAATSNHQLNDKIFSDCHKRGQWCSVISEASQSDFSFLATEKIEDLVLAVSTSGKSPMLAKELVKKMKDNLDNSYAKRLQLLGEMRKIIVSSDLSEKEKRDYLKEILNLTEEDLCKLIKKNKEEYLKWDLS